MTNFILPKPQNEDLFEDIVCAIFAREFRNPNLQRYGRRGQAQQGIDIVGHRYIVEINYPQNSLVAIQCKNHTVKIEDKDLISEVERELDKFDKDNTLPVRHYIFVTSSENSAPIIARVTRINSEREKQGKCSVNIHFWQYRKSC
jgi:hypothetical protein